MNNIFITVVCVFKNNASHLESIVRDMSLRVSSLVTDYELIIVDNASTDQSLAVLKKLTADGGVPNLQVYALTKEVSYDTASLVGLEHALGDYVVVINPLIESFDFLQNMINEAINGADVVFATNKISAKNSFAYNTASRLFNVVLKKLCGVDLRNDAPQFRLVNKAVINHVLKHPKPELCYRYLPATGGFVRAKLEYSSVPLEIAKKKIGESIDNGIRILISTTQVPMRIVTGLSIFGAVANLLYSIYVLGIGLFKSDVAPGWVSLSLQQSGMFLLLTLVLFVLGEYILHMTSVTTDGPAYHICQEFTSNYMTRREKLNIEAVAKD